MLKHPNDRSPKRSICTHPKIDVKHDVATCTSCKRRIRGW